MTRVLITGSSGFIGSHLARACLARGDEVSVIGRAGSDMWRLADCVEQLDQHVVALNDEDAIFRCLESVQPDRIFHLAARTRFAPSPSLDDMSLGLEENVAPLLTLLKAACRLRKPPKALVRAGSIAEYGTAPAPYREDLREAPTNAYGGSMLAATQLMSAMRKRLPFPAITARLALTYGAQQSADFLVPSLIDHGLSHAQYEVRRPEDRRDMIHVSDVVQALLRLAKGADDMPHVINIASGYAPTMREIASEVMKATSAPDGLVSFGAQDKSDRSELIVDPSLMRRVLNWTPGVSFAEGIRDTVRMTKSGQLGGPERRSA